MKVTITARCSFCTRAFDAVDPSVDGIVCDDDSGSLCCDSCRCLICGNGHATDAQFEECGEYADHMMVSGDFGSGDGFDVDAFRDAVNADRAGAI